MKCAYLSGEHVLSCKADRGVYIPSLFELEEYCRTRKSIRCPLKSTMGPNGKAATAPRVYGRWPSPR